MKVSLSATASFRKIGSLVLSSWLNPERVHGLLIPPSLHATDRPLSKLMVPSIWSRCSLLDLWMLLRLFSVTVSLTVRLPSGLLFTCYQSANSWTCRPHMMPALGVNSFWQLLGCRQSSFHGPFAVLHTPHLDCFWMSPRGKENRTFVLIIKKCSCIPLRFFSSVLMIMFSVQLCYKPEAYW